MKKPKNSREPVFLACLVLILLLISLISIPPTKTETDRINLSNFHLIFGDYSQASQSIQGFQHTPRGFYNRLRQSQKIKEQKKKSSVFLMKRAFSIDPALLKARDQQRAREEQMNKYQTPPKLPKTRGDDPMAEPDLQEFVG